MKVFDAARRRADDDQRSTDVAVLKPAQAMMATVGVGRAMIDRRYCPCLDLRGPERRQGRVLPSVAVDILPSVGRERYSRQFVSAIPMLSSASHATLVPLDHHAVSPGGVNRSTFVEGNRQISHANAGGG